MNFLLIISVLFYTITLSYSRQINSVFLAAFDPLYSVSGAYKRLNRDFTSLSDKFAKNSEAHSDTAQTESNKGNDIEYVEPTSSENPEIQKLATEFLMIIKALKEVAKEENKKLLQVLPY